MRLGPGLVHEKNLRRTKHSVLDGRIDSGDAEVGPTAEKLKPGRPSGNYFTLSNTTREVSISSESPLHLLCVAGPNKLSDRLIRLGERRFIRQKDDAEVPAAGFLAETGTVNDEDMFLAAEFFHKNIVAFINL